MTKLFLSHELFGEQTVTLVVATAEQKTVLFSSFISDGFGDLVRHTLLLLKGAETAEFSWADEGPSSDWAFHLNGDILHVRITWFDCQTTVGRRMYPVHAVLFEAECDLLRFATQVKGQLQQLLNDLGAEGYEKRLYHPFPAVEFNELKLLIDQRKAKEW